MKELLPTDPAALVSMNGGTVRWASNDAYAQVLENKPKYTSRVRQVVPNILPVQAAYTHTIHSLNPSHRTPRTPQSHKWLKG